MKEGSHKGVYLLELTMENVRCFKEKTTIDLRDPKTGGPARWTVILGENGTGKTTVLRSLVGMMPLPQTFLDLQAKGDGKWVPRFGVAGTLWNPNRNRRTPSDFGLNFCASISLEQAAQSMIRRHGWRKSIIFTDYSEEEVLELIKHDELLTLHKGESVMVAAYGASRKMSHSGIELDALEDASLTLFDEEATLTNPADILLTVDYKSLKEESWAPLKTKFRDIIIRILPDVKDWEFVSSDSGLSTHIKFQTQDGWIRLRDLSLGYKTTIAWVVDFAIKLAFFYRDSPDPLAEPAICLVDEIDLHMHPSWQRTIMNELSAIFTNTQFIVTAHSPLIVQAAATIDANLVVLKRNTAGEVIVDNEPVNVKRWRVDQILASDLFGNQPPRDDETDALESERKEILTKRELTKEDETRVEVIEEILRGKSSAFETQTEIDAHRLMMEFAQELKAHKASKQ